MGTALQARSADQEQHYGMPVVSVSKLSKHFLAKQKAAGIGGTLRAFAKPQYKLTEAVREISFEIMPGELLAFIGPNGAGKSTTIKMLTGILHPSGGEARVLGMVPWQDRQRLAYNIASVFGQRSQLWYHLPPEDTFNLLAKIYELDPVEYKQRVAYLIDLFEIGSLIQTPARKLSLGERMRCEIAAALLHRPQIIFLDEPTIGLDVIGKSRIRDLLLRMNAEEGTTIFLTSHDAGDIEQVSRRVIVINHGTMVLDTSVPVLKRDYLKTKLIDLKLVDRVDGLEVPGTKIIATSDYGITLQVNTETQPIDTVIGHIVANYRVQDITISDPPLEQIIARIYGQEDGGR